jgi:L-phenylalanine/L-methionine N-acetyltransferase
MTITIRHVEPSDCEAIQRIFSGQQVIWGTSQMPYPAVEMWQKRLAEPPEGLYRFVACVDGEVVGQCGLHTAPNRPRRCHVGQIGIAVRDDWQGKGVGSALMQAAIDMADNWVNLSRLELEVYTDNEPAIKLYRKFGFTIEGTGINYGYRDGEFVDVYFMARLRTERLTTS